jgi:hypothetical protein
MMDIGWKMSKMSLIFPYCSSENVKKDGHNRDYQKYDCESCKKEFNHKAGTIFHYSHVPLKNETLSYRHKIYLARFGKWGKLGILQVVVYIYLLVRPINFLFNSLGIQLCTILKIQC